MARKESNWLTTGQAAKLCSVTPDTILKWIQKGKLQGVRTAGGHYRIRIEDIEPLRTAGRASPGLGASPDTQLPAHMRCWEYLSDKGTVREECKSCVVYRVRAAWCFQMASMGSGLGHARRFCQTSCDDCVYYRRVRGLDTNVLVVTADQGLVARLKGRRCEGLSLRFARNSYEASAAVQTFLPAFALVDRDVAAPGEGGLLDYLSKDDRVPGLKVILILAKGKGGNAPGESSAAAVIEKPFDPEDIVSVIRSFPVESADAECDGHPGFGHSGTERTYGKDESSCGFRPR
ncbi:MAG: excisionase family DNA-binding protein [Elusimicrobia bacterium]|nr:excisionase family DNA-binding protein [Elusimicrobiota bacterium]